MPKQWKRFKKGIEEAVNPSPRTKKRFRVRRMVDGKPLCETFETIEEAEQAVGSFKTATKRFGKLTSKYVDADWREYTEAKRLLPSGVSLVEAAIYYKSRKVSDSRPESIEAASALFLDAKRTNASARYFAELEGAMREMNSRWGHRPPEDIGSELLLNTLLAMRADRSPRTIRNYFTKWRTFFNWLDRRKFIESSPLQSISAEDLPLVTAPTKNPLKVEQVAALMKEVETNFSQWALWHALQFFLGFREAEASRFHYEWIQPDQKRVMIPGWFFDEGADGSQKPGSKTRDDWALYDIPDVFWKWQKAYAGKGEKGPIPAPNRWRWHCDLRPAAMTAIGLDHWPENCRRDSFCTHHISLYRDLSRTALALKHRSPERLWKSYLGTMVSKPKAKAYFQINPQKPA